MKKKLTENDKKLKEFVKRGGRDGAKKDFFALVKLASQPSKTSQK